MGASQREALAVVEAKRKYWEKVLSDDAVEWNLWATFDVFRLASFLGDWVLSDTLFSSLLSIIFLDIPLSDVVPLSLAWEVRLPSVEEFLRGVLIVLEPVDVTLEFPELASVADSVKRIFTEEAAEGILTPVIRKAVYGETCYDESYYDPPAVREFLRSTLFALLKKDLTPTEAATRVEAIASTLGVDPLLASIVFDRAMAISAAKEQLATWDYAWWDHSMWSGEGEGEVVRYTGLDGVEREVEYNQLWDCLSGAWWDEAVWEYSFWTDDVSAFRLDPERAIPVVDRVVNYLVENFRRRLLTTALAAANYQTAEERSVWWKSPRVETFAVPYSHRRRIEELVDSVLAASGAPAPPFAARLYKTAALEVYGKRYGVHGWGDEAYKAMSGSEFKQYWIEKWVSEGLDPILLERIYETVSPVVDALGCVRVVERVRFIREKLGRVSG